MGAAAAAPPPLGGVYPPLSVVGPSGRASVFDAIPAVAAAGAATILADAKLAPSAPPSEASFSVDTMAAAGGGARSSPSEERAILLLPGANVSASFRRYRVGQPHERYRGEDGHQSTQAATQSTATHPRGPGSVRVGVPACYGGPKGIVGNSGTSGYFSSSF